MSAATMMTTRPLSEHAQWVAELVADTRYPFTRSRDMRHALGLSRREFSKAAKELALSGVDIFPHWETNEVTP